MSGAASSPPTTWTRDTSRWVSRDAFRIRPGGRSSGSRPRRRPATTDGPDRTQRGPRDTSRGPLSCAAMPSLAAGGEPLVDRDRDRRAGLDDDVPVLGLDRALRAYRAAQPAADDP